MKLASVLCQHDGWMLNPLDGQSSFLFLMALTPPPLCLGFIDLTLVKTLGFANALIHAPESQQGVCRWKTQRSLLTERLQTVWLSNPIDTNIFTDHKC